MSKHTPAPWKMRADPCPNGSPFFWIDAKDGFYGDGTHGFSVSGIMTKADARLITAAPDLLAALEKFMAKYEGFTNDELHRREAFWGVGDYAYAREARAAIAKSKGE
jgi:hypothetical protein